MNFTLSTNDAGQLVLSSEDGTRHDQVRPARLFPLTDPDHWISLQDASGLELACIEDPVQLPPAQALALNTALAKRAFVPVVRAIHRITRANDGYDWMVTTDRGSTTFRTDSDESIQNLGGSRLVIIDSRNTRYLIPDLQALDTESRRRLERYY